MPQNTISIANAQKVFLQNDTNFKGANKENGSFISVSTEETSIAEILKDFLERNFPRLSPCFTATRDMSHGKDYVDQIFRHLARTQVHFVIFSERSCERHWLHLEAGASISHGIPVIPLTHGGLRPNELLKPYDQYHGVDLTKRTDFIALCNHLAEITDTGNVESKEIRVTFNNIARLAR